MVYWDDLGFATGYTVDAEPEYPADGDWGVPEVRLLKSFGSLLGAPLAVIRPIDAEPWLLSASIAEWGALYGSPNPHEIYFLDRFLALIRADVRRPTEYLEIDTLPIHISASVQQGLLLVAGQFDLDAFDEDGLRWRSERLFLDDLQVVRTFRDRIVCSGSSMAGPQVEVVLDAATGAVTRGRPVATGAPYLRPGIPAYVPPSTNPT
jgi:hypothetical protein